MERQIPLGKSILVRLELMPAFARLSPHVEFDVALRTLFVPRLLPGRFFNRGGLFFLLGQAFRSRGVALLDRALRMNAVARIGWLAADGASFAAARGYAWCCFGVRHGSKLPGWTEQSHCGWASQQRPAPRKFRTVGNSSPQAKPRSEDSRHSVGQPSDEEESTGRCDYWLEYSPNRLGLPPAELSGRGTFCAFG